MAAPFSRFSSPERWRRNDPFAETEYANAAAEISTTNFGAVDSIPNRDEVTSFLGFSI